jgi:hypothetical protein
MHTDPYAVVAASEQKRRFAEFINNIIRDCNVAADDAVAQHNQDRYITLEKFKYEKKSMEEAQETI